QHRGAARRHQARGSLRLGRTEDAQGPVRAARARVMKRGGSVYVAVVFALLFGYFAYQWWFNPSRAVKRRLGEVAAALSMPPDEPQAAKLARLARLRRFLAANVRLREEATGRELMSRDEALALA